MYLQKIGNNNLKTYEAFGKLEFDDLGTGFINVMNSYNVLNLDTNSQYAGDNVLQWMDAIANTKVPQGSPSHHQYGAGDFIVQCVINVKDTTNNTIIHYNIDKDRQPTNYDRVEIVFDDITQSDVLGFTNKNLDYDSYVTIYNPCNMNIRTYFGYRNIYSASLDSDYARDKNPAFYFQKEHISLYQGKVHVGINEMMVLHIKYNVYSGLMVFIENYKYSDFSYDNTQDTKSNANIFKFI